MKKKIIAIGICSALIICFGGCNGGENVSGGGTSSDNVTTAAETTENTEASAEVTSAAEVSETAETTRSTEGLTVSPSGYVLDPNVTLGEHEYAYMFAENQPCFIDETDEGVRVYGVNTDTEREYHYINPFEEHFSTKSCVILEHNGIAEEFAGEWCERFGTAMSVYSDDFDGDGETDIATVRYSSGGSYCRIMELVLYKQTEGHYQRFWFDEKAFIDKYLTYEVDTENEIVTFSAESLGKTFSYDFSEDMPNGGCNVIFGIINDIEFDGNEIVYTATPHLSGSGICTDVSVIFRMKFPDGEFVCTDVEFIKEEPYSSAAEPKYAIDLDAAVSNIIAAGVEADNSEFILSGTEESDGETYYKIIKGYDNGEAVSTEDIFRVSTENGSVYLYIDPTLPMSYYQAQFMDGFDENDPQSRYIQIYDGKP